jgi:hypothetical protein
LAEIPTDAKGFLDTLSGFCTVLSIKVYRMSQDGLPPVPTLPCLDHEAMLHEGIDPHIAAYTKDASDNLHEVVFIPAARRLDVEVASTMGECTKASQDAFMEELRRRFPGFAVKLSYPSRLRGEYRVVNACRAHVSLRDVLVGTDLDKTNQSIDRLQTISSLMEKQSRSASWGARTVMTPLIAVAGFITYEVLGTLAGSLDPSVLSVVRYVAITAVGSFFLYYGVKAVQLTEMANRVWKRSTEYHLILAERRRLERSPR